MTTVVGSGEILTTSSDSPDPKIGGRCKWCAIVFYGDRFEIFIGCNAKFCNFWIVAIATEVDRL